MALTIALFLSCEDNAMLLNQINRFDENPVGIAHDIRMVYTDSAIVKAVLTAPLHLDYTHLSFKYSEFPEGLKIVFYSEDDLENTVLADYGILYNQTKIVDLQGNVVLLSHDGSRLETEQLYWDSEKEWLFTEEAFTFQNIDYDDNTDNDDLIDIYLWKPSKIGKTTKSKKEIKKKSAVVPRL